MNPQILFVERTRCQGCGAIHTSSRLFSVDPLDPNGRHIKPATTFYGTRHLEKIATEVRITPICHTCVDEHTVPTISETESHARWQAVVARKREEERRARTDAKARAPKPVPTIEDLA